MIRHRLYPDPSHGRRHRPAYRGGTKEGGNVTATVPACWCCGRSGLLDTAACPNSPDVCVDCCPCHSQDPPLVDDLDPAAVRCPGCRLMLYPVEV